MIESHFQHRGFDIRIKEYHKDYVMFFVRTPTGPITGGAKTLILARRKAVEVVDEYTSADWTLSTGAVQYQAGDRDDERRISRFRGKEAS